MTNPLSNEMSDFIINFLLDETKSFGAKVTLLKTMPKIKKGITLKNLWSPGFMVDPIPSPASPLGHFGDVFAWFKPLARVGEIVEGHKHNHNHLSLLTHGRVRLITDDSDIIYTAPCCIDVPKDVVHKFISLDEDTTIYCIFAIRDDAGELTTEYDGDRSKYYGHWVSTNDL